MMNTGQLEALFGCLCTGKEASVYHAVTPLTEHRLHSVAPAPPRDDDGSSDVGGHVTPPTSRPVTPPPAGHGSNSNNNSNGDEEDTDGNGRVSPSASATASKAVMAKLEKWEQQQRVTGQGRVGEVEEQEDQEGWVTIDTPDVPAFDVEMGTENQSLLDTADAHTVGGLDAGAERDGYVSVSFGDGETSRQGKGKGKEREDPQHRQDHHSVSLDELPWPRNVAIKIFRTTLNEFSGRCTTYAIPPCHQPHFSISMPFTFACHAIPC
jgi:hypothetical protein